MSARDTPSLRKIIHCDCDCFYAAVEIRDRPALTNLPVAVGASPAQRGVIATCNYVARTFGVHSALPTAHALQRCPNLVLLPVDMEKYRQVSRQILSIYRDYTSLVEPLSLDEAYLDVTGSTACQGSATRIAETIRARVRDEVGVTVSAGVAPNKFLAKVASDWRKPDGRFTVAPDEVADFVAQLPVSRIFGVGPVTAEKLAHLGVVTCGQLQTWPITELSRRFGQFGQTLFSRCRGVDDRVVTPSRPRKSISVETTFAADIRTLAQCHDEIARLIDRLKIRVDRAEAADRIVRRHVKIRFADFKSTTIEGRGRDLSRKAFLALFDAAVRRRRQAIRLIGVGVGLSQPDAQAQMDLFDDPD